MVSGHLLQGAGIYHPLPSRVLSRVGHDKYTTRLSIAETFGKLSLVSSHQKSTIGDL